MLLQKLSEKIQPISYEILSIFYLKSAIYLSLLLIFVLQLREFLTMQRLIQQIYSTDEDIQCDRCRNNSPTFVSLSCDHRYCVMCLTFMYVKHRKLDPNEGTVKCIKCDHITTLHPSHLQIVTKTLKQQVIPNIEGENQLTVSKNIYGLQYSETINRKIKSEEHSFQHNITPSTAKCFFSKCQSPSSRKKQFSKINCRIHRNQQITHLCFTCQMQPLCIKCSSSTKKHSNHQVKDLQKGIAVISEQTSLAKIEISQKIQQIQLWQRRFEDRGIIIKDRASLILSDIRGNFENLFAKLQQKYEQVVSVCQKNFEDIIERNNNQISAINSSLQILRAHHEKIASMQKESQNMQFIQKWGQIKNEYNLIKPINTDVQFQSKVRFPSNSIFRDIDHLYVQINKMTLLFKNSNLSRVGTCELQLCRSQSKIKKQCNKRLKTNFVSLNSSRDKKKKSNKTEEDQKRLRTQKIALQVDKRNNKMPAYITDFINKKNQKLNGQNSSHILEATSPNIESSKLTSKLSKTVMPQELNRKKKDNMALIKQRMQRKTTQPTIKSRGEGSKKKKMH